MKKQPQPTREFAHQIERGLLQRFQQKLAQFQAPATSSVLLGFSGGVDSLALALLLRASGSTAQSVQLCHVDHQLRPVSGHEANLARELANQIGLPFCGLVRTRSHSREQTGENEARQMRYVALAECAHQSGATTIALAHHRGDQAETVLLHLLRGSGLRGVRGMQEVSHTRIPWWDDDTTPVRQFTIWRPLLDETRQTLHQVVDACGLTPIEDASNLDDRFDRNWVRLELLPQIKQRFPSAESTLSRFASLAASDDSTLDEIAQSLIDQIGAEALARRELPLDILTEQSAGIQLRVMHGWLRLIGVREPTFERVATIVSRLSVDRSAWQEEAGNGITVQVRADRIVAIG